MNQNNNGGFGWPVLIVALIIGIMASIVGSIKAPAPQHATFEPDHSSFEHRYVKERVKLEGYSDAESKQAADAIIKFHNAQQERKR